MPSLQVWSALSLFLAALALQTAEGTPKKVTPEIAPCPSTLLGLTTKASQFFTQDGKPLARLRTEQIFQSILKGNLPTEDDYNFLSNHVPNFYRKGDSCLYELKELEAIVIKRGSHYLRGTFKVCGSRRSAAQEVSISEILFEKLYVTCKLTPDNLQQILAKFETAHQQNKIVTYATSLGVQSLIVDGLKKESRGTWVQYRADWGLDRKHFVPNNADDIVPDIFPDSMELHDIAPFVPSPAQMSNWERLQEAHLRPRDFFVSFKTYDPSSSGMGHFIGHIDNLVRLANGEQYLVTNGVFKKAGVSDLEPGVTLSLVLKDSVRLLDRRHRMTAAEKKAVAHEVNGKTEQGLVVVVQEHQTDGKTTPIPVQVEGTSEVGNLWKFRSGETGVKTGRVLSVDGDSNIELETDTGAIEKLCLQDDKIDYVEAFPITVAKHSDQAQQFLETLLVANKDGTTLRVGTQNPIDSGHGGDYEHAIVDKVWLGTDGLYRARLVSQENSSRSAVVRVHWIKSISPQN